jgi:uncharacterized membrane protein YfcA
MTFTWSILVIVFAGLLKGVTGFGFGIIAMPFLIHWYQPKDIIPVITFCNLISSSIILMEKQKKEIITAEIKSIIIFASIFTVAGVIILKYIDNTVLTRFMGIVFIILSVISLIKRSNTTNINRYTGFAAGAFIGLLTGIVSASGPALALLLNRIKISNAQFRYIFALFSVITATIAITGYWYADLISYSSVKLSISFAPILIFGSLIGKVLNNIIPNRVFKTITIIITIIASIALLIK